MKTYSNLYEKLTSYENLEKSFKKAKKGKSSKQYVIEFETNLKENLLALKSNFRKFQRKSDIRIENIQNGILSYDSFILSLQGWLGYAMWANTYKLRMNLIKTIDTLKIKMN